MIDFVSGSLCRGRHSWRQQRNYTTSSGCGLMLSQLPFGESILSAFTGRHSCPFNGTYSKARPDPFPDRFGGCTSTSISNFPPRRMKLITSPVLRCSTQLPFAVKCTSWPVANKSQTVSVQALGAKQ